MKCTECHGYGAVELPRDQWPEYERKAYAAGADAPEVVCPACGGSGQQNEEANP